jgi:hypothetical protein
MLLVRRKLLSFMDYHVGLAISAKKYSAEEGIDRTIGLFLPYSGCSAEQETLGIPFRTMKNVRNSVLWNKIRSELMVLHSELVRGRENNWE